MRSEVLIASIVSIAVLVAFYGANEGNTDAFGEWKGKFGVSWAPEEEAYRRLIFEKNIIMIEKHNADASQTYKMGINQFTVYTTEEFAMRFLNVLPTEENAIQEESQVEIIGDIDWVAQGKVSGVKNQGSCGSCWAFSATGTMESWALITGKGSHSLSEQQLVDCSRAQGNQGCNGGWPSNALNYVKSYGIASESEYRYAAKDQNCQKNGGTFKIAGQQSYSGCNALTSGINSRPIAIAVDATNWSPYTSGVFSNCKTTLNHAVLLVGVIGGNWKVKNSWGTTWGEKGYIRLAAGNTCGLCNHAGVVPT
jgi:C1A family cysteine protease